jgi:hypothetical protein
MSPETIRLAAERLSRALEADGFAGWDPYDALSSPLVRACARTPALRVAAVQAFKRAPVNPRPALGVPKRRHTKGLALLVSAYSHIARLEQGAPYRPLALRLAEELAGRAVPTDGGVGFAYDFDVQTRWGAYRAGQPNAVVTAFAAHALLDAAELGAAALATPAVAALDFACSELLVEEAGERWFAYYAGSRTPIHNASLLIAGVVARAAEPGSASWEAARGAIAYSLARQRPDGSWPYGEHPRLGWVDGLHTAYALEALARWDARAGHAAVRAALGRGLDLYLTRLIDPDGAPRATVASRYPLDIHAAASAVTALCRLAAYDQRAQPAAASVLDWTLRTMRRRDGRFAFQRHRLWRNAVPYVRWSDGHMLLALASYLENQERCDAQ